MISYAVGSVSHKAAAGLNISVGLVRVPFCGGKRSLPTFKTRSCHVPVTFRIFPPSPHTAEDADSFPIDRYSSCPLHSIPNPSPVSQDAQKNASAFTKPTYKNGDSPQLYPALARKESRSVYHNKNEACPVSLSSYQNVKAYTKPTRVNTAPTPGPCLTRMPYSLYQTHRKRSAIRSPRAAKKTPSSEQHFRTRSDPP